MNPTMVPQNMRYRGPVESMKVNNTKLGMFQDLYRLYRAMEEQRARLASLAQGMIDGRQFDGAIASAGSRAELLSFDGALGLSRRIGQVELQIRAGGGSLA